MRKTISLILSLIIIVFSSFVSAQTSGVKSLLWEISGNGLENPSWLFGTMHIIPKKEFKPYPVADAKLKTSEQLILEVDINIPLSTKVQMAKMLMLPAGSNVKDFMSEEEFAKFKSFVLDSLGVKEKKFNLYMKMKPFVVYSALIPEIIGTKIEGFELYYNKIAKKKKIPVVGLETFQFQLAIFDSIPEEDQVRMFLLDDQNSRASFDQLLELYLSQDIYAMAEQLVEDENSARFEEELLILRNKAWAPRLIELMQDKSSFIAVGAAHLAGEHGLIQQLRNSGYKVEAVIIN